MTVSVWTEGTHPRRDSKTLPSLAEAASALGGTLVEGPTPAEGETFSRFSFVDSVSAREFLCVVNARPRSTAMLDDEEKIAARLAARRRKL